MSRRRPWSLARRLLVLQGVIVAVIVAGGAALAWVDVAERAEESSAGTVTALARALADTPMVAEAVTGADPTRVLQPYTAAVLADTGIDFITIMAPDGTRFTHPDPRRIGGKFLGTTAPALAGQAFTETYTGTLGPSVRAVVPVFGPDRQVIALVAAGITVAAISDAVGDRVLGLLAVAGAALVVGTAGSYLVSRRLRRQTGGLAPAELRRVIGYHESILHAVREGLVLLDADHRVTLCNDGVRALLDLPADAEGRRVDELGLPSALVDNLVADTEMHDELHLTDTRVLVVNSSTVRVDGRPLGTVVTLRDRTDLQALTGELDTVRGFTESLRAQAHEAANRLHTVVSLVELGRADEAIAFATEELALAQRLTDQVVAAVDEPVLAALLLGKAAQAAERGVDLQVDAAPAPFDRIPARDLVTILGNLIDNAIDAAATAPARRTVAVHTTRDGPDLVLTVTDTGPGLPPNAFDRGWSTKDDGRGLGLALVAQAVRRCRGTIEVSTGPGAEFLVRLPLGERS
ncbi:ATP-binding protein [Actinokineospora sp. NPDC004072]